MTESRIFPGEKAPLLFGHRGCPQLAPENSLSSFQKILEHKVPGIELDVQICKSGEIVVFHDNNLKRLTGFDGKLMDQRFEFLRTLDCGSFFSKKYKNEKIPLLEEVFSLLGDKVYYDIELKADYFKSKGLEKKVLQMIRYFKLEKRVIISSFNPIPLIIFGKLSSQIPLSLIYSNTDNLPYILKNGKARYLKKMPILKPDSRLLNPNNLKKLNKNYSVMTWTVDDKQDFDKLNQWGLDGICSNRANYFASR